MSGNSSKHFLAASLICLFFELIFVMSALSALSVSETSHIVIRQFIGIASDSKIHMKHYKNSSFVKPSQKIPRLAIVSIVENRIRIGENEIAIDIPSRVSSNLFNLCEYTKRVAPAMKEIIQSQA